MRRTDDTPLDPEIAAQLDAIDATLAGDPVDPVHAELAELALLLVAGRPTIEPGFARELDERVERRFAGPPAEHVSAQAGPRGLRRWVSGSLFGPLAGLSAGVAVVIVAVITIGSLGGGSSSGSQSVASDSRAAPTSTSAASSAIRNSAGSASGAAGSAASAARSATSSAGSERSPATSTPDSTAAAPFSAASGAISTPRPAPNGRKIIQSAQLALTTQTDKVDSVSQELYDVVGRENGYVNSSSVTAGSGGYAQFELSVPSSELGDTMTALSRLQYATVASRTDNVQDVNGQYLSDQRTLADARALRTSLLKQLAAATTQEQVDSLKARLRDAEAAIRGGESTLHNLTHKIDYSQVTVSLNSAAAPVAHHHSGGFTIGRAAHDAGRVLVVAAGVALITLAVLVPVGLVAALAGWIAVAARRRRREQALDLA